ncbi:MAG: D-amino-acid oxidase [Acidiferrobacteraceae bacterium]|nr:D-amino-acid oxidase [Acidiferrobacteraceae bacterium]
MPILVEPLIPDSFPTAPTEVVIIGGGIIGVSAALTLAERGIAVTLCDKGEIGAEQSSRNWGWCRQQGRDPREMPLIMESLKRWGAMNQRVGADTGFKRCGTLYLADSEASLSRHGEWLESAKPFGIDAGLINADEVAGHLPGAARDWHGALYCPSDGKAEPFVAAPAMARCAQSKGAVILTQTAVLGLDISAGSVSGVLTEKGLIRANAVLLAAGAWSRLFCTHERLLLPQLKVRSSVLRTDPVAADLNPCISAPDFSIRLRADGGYTVAAGANSPISFELTPDSFRFLGLFARLAWMTKRYARPRLSSAFAEEWRHHKMAATGDGEPFTAQRVLDPPPLQATLDSARNGLLKDFPVFRGVDVAQQWAGMIDVTPDAVPVISEVSQQPGFFIATGFSGHGFGIGPAAGELAADLVMHQTPLVDPEPFRFSRFSDGSPINPVVGI